jgi:DNA-binding GntR family transcriptional regulator
MKTEQAGTTARDGRRKKATRSEDLAHRLESEILSGTVPPGTRLDEQSLARRFGVSRTPVREALRHLASSGLVQIRAHHGAIVRQLTLHELIEMFQVIAELEGLGARLAARRITAQDRVQLKQSHEAGMRHAEKREEALFFEENNHLHDIILLASRNKFLIDEVHDLIRRVNPYRRFVTQNPGVMEKSVVEHAAVIAAIEKGDGAAAHDLMRAHLNMLGEEAGDFVASVSLLGKSSVPHGKETRAVPTKRGRRGRPAATL